MSKKLKELFDYDKKEDFPARLSDWIGDFFYDILPEHGYEVREEQIFTAFQLADAVCKKKVHLAEAGLGTGKTFAYLLTAIAYARFSGKPVVIACASTALQEQLSGPNGDISTLSRILGIEIDARMAKHPHQYICDTRVNEAKSNEISDEINEWLANTNHGERSEIPHVSDRIWKQIGWDESMSCDMCLSRGFCKLVKAREYYRAAKELIVADHEIFFEDLWTREELISNGKLTILPAYSAVIFDEGHKVILPAVMSAGQQIVKEDMDTIILSLEQMQGARESLVAMVPDLEVVYLDFFEKLDQRILTDEYSERLAIKVDDTLLKGADTFRKSLENLLLELQIEQELYQESIPESLLQTYETQIERAILALNRFCKNKSKDIITWVDQQKGSFWVVPRNISEMMDLHLFRKGLPVVFTSATLSNEGDFAYFARTLGLKNPSSSTVGSSFDIENQATVYLDPSLEAAEGDRFLPGINKLISLLKQNKGSALVLTNSINEVKRIRKGFEDYQLPFEVLWEDKGERGALVRRFREDVSSVLIGASFWEGIDVPGKSLTLLVVWKLPFPSSDPLIEARRKEAKEAGLDPVTTVDYPEMGLKLKQGCGRLIRTEQDQGSIVILDSVVGKPWEKVVLGALPPEAKIIDELEAFTKS